MRRNSGVLGVGLIVIACILVVPQEAAAIKFLKGRGGGRPRPVVRPKPPSPKPSGSSLKTGGARAAKPKTMNPLTAGMRSSGGVLGGRGFGAVRPPALAGRPPGATRGVPGRPSNVASGQWARPLPPRATGALAYRGNGLPNPRAAAVPPRRNLEALKSQHRPDVFVKLPNGFHRLKNPRMGVIPKNLSRPPAAGAGSPPRPTRPAPNIAPRRPTLIIKVPPGSKVTIIYGKLPPNMSPTQLVSLVSTALAAQRGASRGAQSPPRSGSGFAKAGARGAPGANRPPLRRQAAIKSGLNLKANPATRTHFTIMKGEGVIAKANSPFVF